MVKIRTHCVHVSTAILKLAEGTTIDLIKNTRGLMNTRACRKSVDLVENTSLQNLRTLTHVSPSCDSTCDWSKLHAWPTPWKQGLMLVELLVAISHVIGRNWPDRLSPRITYWLAIAHRQVNKLFFSVLLSTCVCAVDTKTKRVHWKPAGIPPFSLLKCSMSTPNKISKTTPMNKSDKCEKWWR